MKTATPAPTSWVSWTGIARETDATETATDADADNERIGESLKNKASGKTLAFYVGK
jgi:hypothetical protein